MCEPVDPIQLLRDIPFAVASIQGLCTKPGSYEREIVSRVYRSIWDDIARCVRAWEEERKLSK